MKKIYVAGPYSNQDPDIIERNVETAIEYAEKIAELGYAPFVPHLFHAWDKKFKHDYEFWMTLDIEFLKVCDGIFMIPGESPGADREETFALYELELPNFKTIEDLDKFDWIKHKKMLDSVKKPI